MTKAELKQLIRESINEAVEEGVFDVGDWINPGDEKQNAAQRADQELLQKKTGDKENKLAQRLVGKTIKSVKVNQRDGSIEIEFTNGQEAFYGKADGSWGFEFTKL